MSFSRAVKRRTKKHYGVANLQEAEKNPGGWENC